jgi:hypothetical protein
MDGTFENSAVFSILSPHLRVIIVSYSKYCCHIGDKIERLKLKVTELKHLENTGARFQYYIYITVLLWL